ncbi:hypothetical protein F4778DRAFT_201755 [Xylariomycetidae sp. FL2044]|nr:hypothetical protein F4778DRAFT_201755 [Xylariomycetidae sp. FL2044]
MSLLAGHIGTPSGAAQRQLGDMDDGMHSDVDYRRTLGPERPHQDFKPPYTQRSNMQPRLTTQREQPGGRGSFAFNTLGGVVGKVWEFCKAGAFRGFSTGGDRGCEMQPTSGSARHLEPDDVWRPGALLSRASLARRGSGNNLSWESRQERV